MDLKADMLARIEAYLAQTGMPATTFGRMAVRDGNFVHRLRAGRSLTLRTHARVVAFLQAPPPAPYRRADAGAPDLAGVIRELKENRAALQAAGVAHAAVFGSVARGRAHPGSDVDILIEVDASRPLGLFAISHLKRKISDMVPQADVVERRSLHPAIAGSVLDEAVYAF